MMGALDAMPGAMVRVDREGNIYDLNQAAHRLVDRLHVGASLPDELDEGAARLLMHVLREGEGRPVDTRELEALIGKRRFRLSVAGQACAEDRLVIKLTDITEFRELSERVALSEQRFRSLFYENPDSVFSLDVKGRFTDANRSTLDMIGMPQIELMSRHWVDFVDPQDLDRVRTSFQAVLAGDAFSFRCRVKSCDGRIVLAHVTQVPMVVDSEVVGVFGVARDITEAKQRQLELHRSREELRRLYSAQDGMLERERLRIARDLHDELGQTLTALKLDLGVAISDKPDLPVNHVKRLQELVRFIDGTIGQVREIASNLRPAMLDDLGFEAAAEWFLDKRAARDGLDIRWRAHLADGGRTTGETATALYRILQECMTNISRHAQATTVTIDYEETLERAKLEVADNGIGFDASRRQAAGFGLVGMRERVAMLDGELSVDSSIGSGTRIVVTLPLTGNRYD
ncbi:PAS domain-containing sensor histidine kinase [Marinobacter fonticola]|uniref:PAS domain-containing sensor histidine kinase n=1 Tax=Marinobacter fonticola TaxID=2603215 RepID=UPI00143D350B|nr:PAS domain S-box protein [Marinobacter fonticola]